LPIMYIMSIYEWEKNMGKKGFSLMELMVVVVIVGVIAAVAIPSYLGYITRTRRADAVTALQTVALCEEKARAETGSYQPTATLIVSYGLTPSAGGFYTPSQYYRISVAGATATAFTAYANPINAQAGDFILAINQDGVGGTSTTVGGALVPDARLWSSLKKEQP
jgi:type IV pilus assembly protein PilE